MAGVGGSPPSKAGLVWVWVACSRGLSSDRGVFDTVGDRLALALGST